MRVAVALLGLFGAIVMTRGALVNSKRTFPVEHAWDEKSTSIDATASASFARKNVKTGITHSNIPIKLCPLRFSVDYIATSRVDTSMWLRIWTRIGLGERLQCCLGEKADQTSTDGVGRNVRTFLQVQNGEIWILMICVIIASGFGVVKRLVKNIVYRRAMLAWVVILKQVVFTQGEWTILAKNQMAAPFPSTVKTTGLYGQVSDANFLNLPLWSSDKLFNGLYTLRLRYWDSSGKHMGTIIWKQSSNPWISKSTTVTGFQLVSKPTGWNDFSGLYCNTHGQSILEGIASSYYSVGGYVSHFTLCGQGVTCTRMELSIESITPSPSTAPTTKPGIAGMISKGYYDVQRVGVVFDPINCFTQKATITIKYSGRIRAIVLRWARGKISTSPRAVQGRFGDAKSNRLMVVIVRKSMAGNDEVVFPRAGTVGYSGGVVNTNLYTMDSYNGMSNTLIFEGPPLGVLAGSKIYVCSGDSVGPIQDVDTNDGSVEYVVDLFYETPANQVNVRPMQLRSRRVIIVISVLSIVVALCLCVGVVYCRTSNKKKALIVKQVGNEHLNLYGSVSRV